MQVNWKKTACVSVVIVCACFSGMKQLVQASVLVGIPEYVHAGFPDNSQFPDAYSPQPPHADLWWTDANKNATNMCGPTAAKNSAVWLSYQGRHTNAKRLRQIKQGENWVDPTNDSWLIERFAELVGEYQNWDWSKGVFEGTKTDDAYVKAKKKYFAEREVPATVKLFGMSDNSFDQIAHNLKAGQDIELSWLIPNDYGHWFSVMGVRTDIFKDSDEDGVHDPGEPWINDHNSNGVFDRYLNIHDPWPVGSNDGWKQYVKEGNSYYLEGWDAPRALDTYVIECVIAEPSTFLIFLGFAAFAWATWGRKKRLP